MALLYKPKFCCECGERVERAEWRPWTNRRFCEFCETEFQGEDIGRKVFSLFGGFAIIAGVFGIYGVQRPAATESLSSPQVVSGSTLSENLIGPQQQHSTDGKLAEPTQALVAETTPVSAVPVYGARDKGAKPVYYCGALTKKGTACSRRVKEKGHRCWQHSASLNH